MSGEGGSIVVIDDSFLILERIRERLSSAGYTVHTTTGQLAASKLVKGADLTIIDYHMPGINGKEMLGILRSSLPGTRCQFYLYTSDRDVANKYDQLGFDGAFLKKGDEAALVPQVDAVFRTIRMRQLAEKMRKERLR